MINPDIFTGRLGNRMFQIAYLYSQVKDGLIPDWYVQNPKYFKKCSDEIKALFGAGIRLSPYVAIHIRQAGNPINPDEPKYSENPFYVNLAKTEYYELAVRWFEGEQFLVFSDDIDFAKKYFLSGKFGNGGAFFFDDTADPVKALNRMAGCKGHIIANSSFSWWAAYLCPHHNQKVVAPSKDRWYSDGVERTVCPTSWIRL